METQIRNEIKTYCEKVIKSFELFFKRFSQRYLKTLTPSLEEATLYAISTGGKRIRPLLFLASAESVNPEYPESLNYFAAGLEMIHTYTLVHDDLPSMDDDVERRGKPAVHIAYGESTALLVGDLLLTEGARLLIHPELRKDVETSTLLQMADILLSSVGANGVVNGQYLDKYLENRKTKRTNLFEMYRLKTGNFISACIVCGYLAGEGKDRKKMKLLKEGGLNFGYAYQIANDIFDFMHRKEDYKKGKATVIKFYGLKNAIKDYEEYMDRAFKNIIKATEPGSPLVMAIQYIDEVVREKWISSST